jgi:acyl-CoA hydrolase
MSRTLLELFQPGRRVYLPGASGESLALAQALSSEPGRLRGVELVSCLVPGMNTFDYAALDPEARVTTFLLPPVLRAAFEAGRVRLLPLAYSAIARYLASPGLIDVAVAHVTPPDAEGRCALGVAADFTPIAWRSAGVRAAIVNPMLPRLPGPTIKLAEADVVVEMPGPPVAGDTGSEGEALTRIAAAAAGYVADGAAIQLGIGGAPGAIWPHLRGHRDLRIASGMVTDGAAMLDSAGALASEGHRAGIAFGPVEFYRWLEESRRIELATTAETHDVTALARLPRFTAINSALEVDLFGQVNLEWQGTRLASGVGGAPDFARAAALSDGGRSLVLLPAKAKGGTLSRIVARIEAPTVSIPRSEADVVITEHGVAELRGRSLDERAGALIAVAAPEWRDRLGAAWRELRARL